ncbi:hypothetical protein HPT27_00735 [Permianibacter sp. IMCC34836]|uniref:hypothetical protein n=1 Tax=Permianibacter fluminis TaxID=2738515 RepID=UPI00155456AD|nr:hypothetical protein [Permianibacter fluminis]NQD35526.1 hypothetical protein [Permianibacter fluminis]
MKPLLFGVLCAGLLGQAPVQAFDQSADELPGLGHASLGWQQDSDEGDSAALALALPLSPVWYLNASAVRANSQMATLSGSESVQATSTRLGLSLEQSGWGGGLSLLRYDDDMLLKTDEAQLALRHRGEQLELGLELSKRSHEVSVTLQFPLQVREYSESFDSRGVGANIAISSESGLRAYGALQQYDYDDARVLSDQFGQYLLSHPRLYLAMLTTRQLAQGGLAKRNGWLGVDVPVAEHLLTFEHFVSVPELDDGSFRTDSVTLALNLGERWGLDLNAGINRGEQGDDIRFAGLTAHVFW